MKHLVFVIFDTKAKSYGTPITVPTEQDVFVALKYIVNDETLKHDYTAHPEDFQLFRIGEYDVTEGVLTSVPHEHVTTLHMLKD